MDNLDKKAGISILGLLVLAVLFLLVLNYFHLSVKIVPDSSSPQSNINYIGEVVKSLWNQYLEKPVHYIWNDFILPFISSIKNGNYGQPSDDMSPQINFGQ